MIVWLNGIFGAGKTTTAAEPAGLPVHHVLLDADEETLRRRVDTAGAEPRAVAEHIAAGVRG